MQKSSRRKKIVTYEDFQDHVTDKELIDGAYKIGVLSWEAYRLLHQARETRNIFSGHPKSSEPELIKVLNLISDCNTHVLSVEYPPSIIDISTYLSEMDKDSYDRNDLAIEQAFSDLPAIYKSELSNRFYTAYVAEKHIIKSALKYRILCSNLVECSDKRQQDTIGKEI